MRSSSCLRLLFLIAFTLVATGCSFAADSYRIIHTYPHDQQAFTQGLIYLDGYLYESTGLYGRSSLRMEDLTTGRILKFQPVPNNDFGEGLTNWGNTLIQLTWKAHFALIYDRSTFRFLRSVHYPGEGWGLTQNGKQLILSDGTAKLRFLNPTTFREERHITVTYRGKPVTQLNELEWVRGEIYANVWHSNRIARISPVTGGVLGWIDLTGLLPASERSDPEAVLNGIAYDAVHNRLFVTGKLWPKLFEIRVVPNHARVVPVHRRM